MPTELRSDLAIPPGELLAEELETRGMTQDELARRMARPRRTVGGIVAGREAITAETALRLERALGIATRLWVGLESRYRLALATDH